MAIEENDRVVPFVETRHHAPHIVGASALGEEHCCKDGRNDCSDHSSLLDQLITRTAPRTECLLSVWINLGLKSRGASVGSWGESPSGWQAVAEFFEGKRPADGDATCDRGCFGGNSHLAFMVGSRSCQRERDAWLVVPGSHFARRWNPSHDTGNNDRQYSAAGRPRYKRKSHCRRPPNLVGAYAKGT